MLVQKGFSLIELMVVVMIIGVLCSIAMPAYKDYVVRAKLTELFAIAQPAKLAVSEEIMMGTPMAQINNEKLSFEKIVNQGNIQELTIAAGVIKIIGNNKELDIPEGKTLEILLTPRSNGGAIFWKCSASPEEFKKYVPSNCRQGNAAGLAGGAGE